MQKEPLEKHHDKEKSESEYSGGEYQSEQVARFHLITRINDRVAQATFAYAR